jgi:hypothetical protein
MVLRVGDEVIERVDAWIAPGGNLLRVGLVHRDEREARKVSGKYECHRTQGMAGRILTTRVTL